MNDLAVSADEAAAHVDRLQATYVEALDERALHAWLACFTDDGAYVCISAENAAQGLPQALMLDDCPERLRDRVKFIEQVWAGTYEDYQTRHFVQRLRCERSADGLYAVKSNVMVAYTAADGRSYILAAGTYEDRVRLDTTGGARFVAKRVVVDTISLPRYLVYPL